MSSNQDNPMERAHAKLSASGSKQWMNCPGSLALEATLPDEESSEYANLGTAAHSLGEHCLREGFESPSLYLGMWIGLDGEMYETDQSDKGMKCFEVDDDMADAVSVYVEAVKDEMDRLPGSELSIERRFNLSWLRPDMFGTNDACVSDFLNELVVLDYKHGQGVPVEAEWNSQFMYYGIGAAQEDSFLYDKVTFVVIQPRCPHPKGGVRKWSISMAELRKWAEEELAGAADKVREAEEAYHPEWGMHPTDEFMDKYMSPGLETCRWCQAGPAGCEARNRKAMEVAAADFDDDPHELEAPTDLDKIAKALEWVPFLDAWCRSVDAHAQRLAEGGTKVPGFKLVEGRGTRKWIEDLSETDIVKAMTEFGVDASDMYTEPALISGPAAEKLIRGKGSGALKKEMSAKLLFKKPGALTLAPESDPREEVKASAQSDFEDVED